MANEFQETVAIDLKFYNKSFVLVYIIDLCTCLSASVAIPNKNLETMLKFIFKIWVSVYRTPSKFLTENGSEFTNKEFINTLQITRYYSKNYCC